MKKEINMVRLAMVQGRLSSEVAGKFQYFPIHSWRSEFLKAKELGFDSLEWIISDFSNPIFDHISQNEIIKLVAESGLEISSISLDLLMYKTLNHYSDKEISWIFENINKIAKKIKLSRVSIPIEETCGVRDAQNFNKVQEKLIKILKLNSFNKYTIAVETDMTPNAVSHFLDHKDLQKVGVLLDIGNAAAYGYKLDDYFHYIKDKIFSLHIKDRLSGIGPTVALGTGAAEFVYLNKNIHKLINLKDITLQTFKTNENYLEDTLQAKKFIDDNLITRINNN
jgi:sugar phosphate isomerase/epimerase